MGRRDVAAAAAKSWPDTNYQFSRFREADSRTRGPCQGRDAIGKNQTKEQAELTAGHHPAQREIAEALQRALAVWRKSVMPDAREVNATNVHMAGSRA